MTTYIKHEKAIGRERERKRERDQRDTPHMRHNNLGWSHETQQLGDRFLQYFGVFVWAHVHWNSFAGPTLMVQFVLEWWRPRTNLMSDLTPGQAPTIFLSVLLTPDWRKDLFKVIIEASQMVFWSSRHMGSRAWFNDYYIKYTWLIVVGVFLDIAYHCLSESIGQWQWYHSWGSFSCWSWQMGSGTGGCDAHGRPLQDCLQVVNVCSQPQGQWSKKIN